LITAASWGELQRLTILNILFNIYSFGKKRVFSFFVKPVFQELSWSVKVSLVASVGVGFGKASPFPRVREGLGKGAA
jgi:hypothetical protein